jgi:hypothetical protein
MMLCALLLPVFSWTVAPQHNACSINRTPQCRRRNYLFVWDAILKVCTQEHHTHISKNSFFLKQRAIDFSRGYCTTVVARYRKSMCHIEGTLTYIVSFSQSSLDINMLSTHLILSSYRDPIQNYHNHDMTRQRHVLKNEGKTGHFQPHAFTWF